MKLMLSIFHITAFNYVPKEICDLLYIVWSVCFYLSNLRDFMVIYLCSRSSGNHLKSAQSNSGCKTGNLSAIWCPHSVLGTQMAAGTFARLVDCRDTLPKNVSRLPGQAGSRWSCKGNRKPNRREGDIFRWRRRRWRKDPTSSESQSPSPRRSKGGGCI